jgi:16S rRNA (guanine527-N7)-methyltransferase
MAKLIPLADELLGLHLTKSQEDAFEYYLTELKRWNQNINLTRILDSQDILVQHFLDSLSCLLPISKKSGKHTTIQLVDVGSGAGFPGIPIAITSSNIDITLVESTEKKCTFMNQVITDLKLSNARVLNERAEHLGQDSNHREHYDWAIARAVASLPVLAEYLLPLTRLSGYCIAQKTLVSESELSQATTVLSKLGGRLDHIIPVDLPGINETRHLIVMRKMTATPNKYPRRPGMPQKRPLI